MKKPKKTIEQWKADEEKRRGRNWLSDWLKRPFEEPAPVRISTAEFLLLAIMAAILCLVGAFCGE